MGPSPRIAHGKALMIKLPGLAKGQAAALHALIRSSDTGAGFGPAPSSSPGPQTPSPHAGSAVPALTGAPDQIRRFSRLLSSQAGPGADLAKTIDSLLDNYLRSDYKIDCRGRILDLGGRTHLMGILNATPDSFSDGGRFATEQKALAHAREMAAAGADIIDIGGESTRPGADPVPEDEELRRTIPLIEKLSQELSVPISIDTYKSSVAKKALQAGASIVNDISGLRFSPDMAAVVAEHNAAVVIMHIKGTPRSMQQNPAYADVVGEITAYLAEGIAIAEKAGVDRERIMIDPGIGFGKALEHNLEVLQRLDEFRALGRPILLGASRKKFIGAILDIPVPEDRVFGSGAVAALGIERGARILRVHDVKAMAQVARMTDAIVRHSRQ